MALKAEGYDLSVWDEWSSQDFGRYHPGECTRRWNSFHGSNAPVTGATIVKMAQDRGWTPFVGADGIMDWNDVIEYDGNGGQRDLVETRKPTEDLILYLQTLFDPEDHVGYVTNDAWQNEDGKWVPNKGVFDRTEANSSRPCIGTRMTWARLSATGNRKLALGFVLTRWTAKVSTMKT